MRRVLNRINTCDPPDPGWIFYLWTGTGQIVSRPFRNQPSVTVFIGDKFKLWLPILPASLKYFKAKNWLFLRPKCVVSYIFSRCGISAAYSRLSHLSKMILEIIISEG